MTSTFPEHDSDPRIFILCALSSAMLHGLFMVGLAYMQQPTIVKDKPPTVQVTFLPTPEVMQAPQVPTPPMKPQTIVPKATTHPLPLARPNRPQPLVPPLESSLAPDTPIKPALLPPPVQAKPILKDTRASQSMEVKGLMKMREPSPTQHASPSLPTVPTRTLADSHTLPPMPLLRKTTEAPSLPAPPMATTSGAMRASPPARTGPIMTGPTIISSSRPAYPRVARESGWEGTVIVRTLVDTQGIPSEVTIRQSCGHPTLDEAAQDAVRSWTFRPAKDGNIPISKWVDIPIKFDLNS